MACDDHDVRILDALADANDQFHWGRKPEELASAARRLISIGINAALSQQLEAKSLRMKLSKPPKRRNKRSSRSRSCCTGLPVPFPART
jgi:hypothetical protein